MGAGAGDCACIKGGNGLGEISALGSKCGQGRYRAMALTLPQSAPTSTVGNEEAPARRLTRATMTEEEAERCPRSQVRVSQGLWSVVSNAAERSIQTTMDHCIWHRKGHWGLDRALLLGWWRQESDWNERELEATAPRVYTRLKHRHVHRKKIHPRRNV